MDFGVYRDETWPDELIRHSQFRSPSSCRHSDVFSWSVFRVSSRADECIRGSVLVYLVAIDRPWSPGALMHIRHCARRSSCHILATCLYRGNSVTRLAARLELAAQRSLNYRRKHSLAAVVDNPRSMHAYYPRQFMFILARMAPQGACALGHTPLSPIITVKAERSKHLAGISMPYF